ncbi:hypothetical protein AeNC1_007880, partial [Aphanomyces euteiches]
MKIAGCIAALASALAFVQGQVAEYGTCGGANYNGPTTCAAGLTCVQYSIWYSQCVRVTPAPTTTAPTPAPVTPPPPESKFIYFGTATDNPTNYGTIVPDNFNLLVSENGMKWDAHE